MRFARYTVLISCSLFLGQNVMAQQLLSSPRVSIAASSCMPTDDTFAPRTQTGVKPAKYRIGAGGAYVAHSSNATGKVHLTCQIPGGSGYSFNKIRLTYRDGSTAYGNQVVVRLMRVDLKTGAKSQLLFRNTDSMTCQDGDTSVHTCSASTAAFKLDFNSYAYWIWLVLERTNTSNTIRAYGVQLSYEMKAQLK